ncbi:MAG: tetratricopeptide repeat protein [Planctomycetes bacterium]|nr:tetratricopeptide repeat protein [Planctomycetota bacterium]
MRRKILIGLMCVTFSLASTGTARGGDGALKGAAAAQSYYAGNGLLQRGMYEAAIEEYRAFLRDHATHEKAAVARYGLAVSLVRLKRGAEAVPELEALAVLPSFEFAAESTYLLGQCRLDAGKKEDALGRFQTVVMRHPDHALAVEAAVREAEILFELGKYVEASTACRESLRRWPSANQRDRWLLIAGLAESAQGNTAAAAGHFAKVIEDFGKGSCASQAMVGLARCRRSEGKIDEAIRLYQQVLSAHGEAQRAEALLGMGDSLLEKGDLDGAAKAIDEMLAKYDGGALAASGMVIRGRVLLANGDAAQALESFAKAGERSADLVEDIAYWSAKCDVRQGRYKEAAKRLRKAMQAVPSGRLAAEMAYDRVVALLKAGDRDHALDELEAFTKHYEKHPLAATALELLAVTLHESGRYDESTKACKAFAGRYAAHARASSVAFVAAENAFMQQQYGVAAEAFRSFLATHAKDDRAELAKCRLGLALAFGGKPDEATAFLNEAASRAESDERMLPAVIALGNLYFDRGEWKAAEELLQRHVRLAKGDVSLDEAMLKLGLALARQGKSEEALRVFDDCARRFEKSPHAVQAVFERGQVLLSLKRNEEAAKAFEQVLAIAPTSRFVPFAKKHLGTLSLQRGDFKQAELLLAEVSDDGEAGLEAMYQRGLALLAAADYSAAEKVLRTFIERSNGRPSADAARVQLVVTLARQGQHDKALKEAGNVDVATLPASAKATLAYEQAWCWKETGKTEDAAKAYRLLSDDDAAGELQFHAMLESAALESSAKRPDAALAQLERLQRALKEKVDRAPKGLAEEAAYRIGLAQFELNRFADAAATLAQFTAAFPGSELAASACFYAAEAFFRVSKFGDAAKHFEKALDGEGAKQSWGPSAMLRWGDCLGRLEQWGRSEEVLAHYLKENADSETWYQAAFGIGWARENLGRHEEAIASYRSVVERHKGPTAARAQFQTGECLFAMKKYEEAVRELMKVDILYDYPEWSAAALYEAGRCLEKLSKSGEARKQFETVAEKYKGTNWAALAVKRLGELSQVAMPGHPQG